ncbi:MAG: MFS transporter [Burkholderiales bacterium]|nr:MFS transporter [Burkholderiales bacterium]
MSSLPTDSFAPSGATPPAGVTRGTRRYTHISWAMFFGGFATFAQLYCMQSLLPLLSTHFDITPARSSLAVSASTLTMAGGLLVTCLLSDSISRKRLMCAALFSSSLLTILSAFTPGFASLIALCALKGLALSGLPAIAMAYLSEEVEHGSLGMSMGLYISGNILGGMVGRVGSALLADVFSWRVAVAVIGASCFLMSLQFVRSLPPSQRFVPRRAPVSEIVRQARRHLKDPALLGLYLFAGLMMGSFVSVYNYLGFRLAAPPFGLPQAVIGMIFSMYLIGVMGSFIAGPLSDRLGRHRMLWLLVALALCGLLLTLSQQLGWVIGGLALFTFGFFGGHTVASSWVGQHAREGRAAASALYLFFYYMGSTVLGTYTGVVMHGTGWHGVVALLSVALLISLAVSLAMRRAFMRRG